MAAFFYKEIVSNKFLVKGAPVPFEVLDGNRGVIRLEENEENAPLIAELNKAAGRFGVVKISEAEYAEKKTEYPLTQSKRSSPLNEKLRVVQTRQPTNPFARQVGAVAEAELKPPQVVPERPGLQPDPLAGQPTFPLTPPAAPSAPEPSPEAPAGEPTPKFTPSTRRISRRTEGATSS
jgi:hypothetical protein